MSTPNDGGPAFPVSDCNHPGMSLRDYFAGQAPENESSALFDDCARGIMEFLGLSDIHPSELKRRGLQARAKARYMWADAMLKAREASK